MAGWYCLPVPHWCGLRMRRTATQKCRDIDVLSGRWTDSHGVAPNPAPSPDAGIAAAIDPASFTSTIIIIHRAQRQRMRQPRETAQLFAGLFAGTMSDHAGALIDILHTGRVHLAARTPWTDRAPDVDDTRHSWRGSNLKSLSASRSDDAVRGACRLSPGQQILWPLEQLSDISLSVPCAWQQLSQFAGQGGLSCNRAGRRARNIRRDGRYATDWRWRDRDRVFRFRTDVAAPVTLAEPTRCSWISGPACIFGGDIMLWQPAHDRAAGIIAGTPEDVFSDLGGVLIYFRPLNSWRGLPVRVENCKSARWR